MGSEMCIRDRCSIVGVERQTVRLPSPLTAIGSRIGKPFRRFANELAEAQTWASQSMTVDPTSMQATFGFKGTDLAESMADTNHMLADFRDPARREARMVHPQFYATVYEPGSADLNLLPDGPKPRQD